MTAAPFSGSLQYSDRYAAISQRFLKQAQEELEDSDLIQVPEKVWCAAAYAIKSVAEKWGWHHQGHYRLNAAVSFIAIERGQEDLIGLYQYSIVMRVNWHEHELYSYEDTVRIAINATRTFVTEMEKIRAEDVPSLPPPHLTRAQARRLRLLNTPSTDSPSRYADVSLLPPVNPEPPESR